MTARLIDLLVRSGARLGSTVDGTLVASRVPPELASLVAEREVELAAAVAGALKVRWASEGGSVENRTYSWRWCSTCGLEALIVKDRACYLTPGCDGRLSRLNQPPQLVLASGVPIYCARPGCVRPAVALTAAHEPLCSSDLSHLALALDHREKP